MESRADGRPCEDSFEVLADEGRLLEQVEQPLPIELPGPPAVPHVIAPICPPLLLREARWLLSYRAGMESPPPCLALHIDESRAVFVAKSLSLYVEFQLLLSTPKRLNQPTSRFGPLDNLPIPLRRLHTFLLLASL